MLFVEGVVDLKAVVALVGARAGERRDAVVRQSRQLRSRRERQHLGRYRAEARRGDNVSGEWRARNRAIGGDHGSGGVENLSRQLAEIASQHWAGGQRVEAAQLSAANKELVEGGKPEGPVAAVVEFRNDHGTAEGEAELILC